MNMPAIGIPSLSNAIKITSIYSLLGPVIGGLPVVALFFLPEMKRDLSSADLLVFLQSFFFAYLFGFVPSFLTGLASSFAFRNFFAWKWCLFSGLLGFAIAGLVGFAISHNPNNSVPVSTELLEGAVMLGLPGLLGGTLTAAVIGKTGLAKKILKET